MQNNALKIGDVVSLKSGGPSMTVQELLEREEAIPLARCKWFDEKKKSFEEEFVIESLKPAQPQGGVLV